MEPRPEDHSIRQLSILGNLLAIISPDRASGIASQLLLEFQTLGGVFDASRERLNEVADDGGQVSYLIDYAQRAVQEVMRERIYRSHVSIDDRNFLEYLISRVGRRSDEAFLVISLDGSNCFIREELISIGSASSVDVKIASILRPAILRGARGIILVHNHPNGSVVPSILDIQSTNKIREIARYLDIALIDHIIVSRNCCFSMNSNGII